MLPEVSPKLRPYSSCKADWGGKSDSQMWTIWSKLSPNVIVRINGMSNERWIGGGESSPKTARKRND